ncbi:MAG: amino acid--tRNA ligase-related protein, partial [Candidatus Giovannonibacteria bacterium]|nr:amino acid--tRNA ligase-related protein [Candidatus Giovannonibacteria bacterium]
MASSLEEIRRYRIKKLEALQKAGINPYPAKIFFAILAAENIKKNFRKLVSAKKNIGVAGRILAKREHGGSMFLDIFDGSGKLQAFLGKDKIGEKSYSLFSETIDIGDFIALQGKAFYTKRKEATIEVAEWEILAKSLLPMPEKWHGLQDIEERFRKRYLDLLMNSNVKDRFLFRSRLIYKLRSLLNKDGFLEVETPVLQTMAGGASARPFKTRHNALDIDLWLRIATEIHLKYL